MYFSSDRTHVDFRGSSKNAQHFKKSSGFIYGKILLTSGNSYFSYSKRLLLRIIILVVMFTFLSYLGWLLKSNIFLSASLGSGHSI